MLACRSILSLCASDSRVSPYVDPSAMLLAGHSRGGKLSALLASTDPRVKGLALIDPVDVTQMTPKGKCDCTMPLCKQWPSLTVTGWSD